MRGGDTQKSHRVGEISSSSWGWNFNQVFRFRGSVRGTKQGEIKGYQPTRLKD